MVLGKFPLHSRRPASTKSIRTLIIHGYKKTLQMISNQKLLLQMLSLYTRMITESVWSSSAIQIYSLEGQEDIEKI